MLNDKAQQTLTRMACESTGVPLAPHDVALRTGQLAPVFDDSARGPLQRLQARRARRQVERWLATLIDAVRSRDFTPRTGSALHLVACRREAGGNLVASRSAAAELLKLLEATWADTVQSHLDPELPEQDPWADDRRLPTPRPLTRNTP